MDWRTKMKYKDNFFKVLHHLGRLATSGAQFAGFVLMIVAKNHSNDYEYMGSPFVEGLIGFLLIALAVFLESRLCMYEKEISLYVLCVIATPVRVFCQLVTIVRLIIALVKDDRDFAEPCSISSSAIGKFLFVFFGWQHEATDRASRQRAEARKNAEAEWNKAHAAEIEQKRKEAEQKEKARLASLPDDRAGQIFMKTQMCDAPFHARGYSEKRYFHLGCPCVRVSFMLDFELNTGSEYSTIEGAWEVARIRAESHCYKKVKQNYQSYKRKVRNPVSEPSVEFAISRGTMSTKKY